MVEARVVSHSRVIMTEIILPSHTNSIGSVFGGVVMSWIDIAASVSAQRHTRQMVVTASIDALEFVAPVYIGWVINLKSSVNYVGKTSMEVGVRVDAENPRTGEVFHTATAYLTFVAIDKDFKPIEVSSIVPETDEEKRRYEAAKERRKLRLS